MAPKNTALNTPVMKAKFGRYTKEQLACFLVSLWQVNGIDPDAGLDDVAYFCAMLEVELAKAAWHKSYLKLADTITRPLVSDDHFQKLTRSFDKCKERLSKAEAKLEQMKAARPVEPTAPVGA